MVTNGNVRLSPFPDKHQFLTIEREYMKPSYFNYVNHTLKEIQKYTSSDQLVGLHFHRAFSYYVLNVYVPNMVTVSTAGLSLFIPASMAPGRATLCISSLIASLLQGIQVSC